MVHAWKLALFVAALAPANLALLDLKPERSPGSTGSTGRAAGAWGVASPGEPVHRQRIHRLSVLVEAVGEVHDLRLERRVRRTLPSRIKMIHCYHSVFGREGPP